MGFRYRRTVRLSRSTKLNVGSKKASVSVGGPGMTVNLSRRGARATLSAPGTGLSYVTKQAGGSRRRGSIVEELFVAVFIVFLLGLLKLVWRLIVAAGGTVPTTTKPGASRTPPSAAGATPGAQHGERTHSNVVRDTEA